MSITKKDFKEAGKVDFILTKSIYSYKKQLFDRNSETIKNPSTTKKPLPENTVNQILNELHSFDRFLMLAHPNLSDVKEITGSHVDEYARFGLNECLLKKRTVNKKIRSLRKFFNYLLFTYPSFTGSKVIEYNPANNVLYYKVEDEELPKGTSKSHLRLLLTAMSNTKYGLRDTCITRFLGYLGLQLNEILSLKLSEIDTKAKRLTLERDNITYTFDIPDILNKNIKEYIEFRRDNLEKQSISTLFLSNNGTAYSSRSYQYAFKNAVIQANLDDYTPRNIKASFCYGMAKVVDEDKLKIILNQNKVQHYFIDEVKKNSFLP